jgi:hypothetical protein
VGDAHHLDIVIIIIIIIIIVIIIISTEWELGYHWRHHARRRHHPLRLLDPRPV